MTWLVFDNGFMLLYLTALGLNGAAILAQLSLPSLFTSLFIIPSSFLSDSWGKKKNAVAGIIAGILGFFLITVSGSLQLSMVFGTVCLGIIISSIGTAQFFSGWLALLSPIVPEKIRGRFFAKLRISWNSIGIVFMLLIALFLSKNSPVFTFQAVLSVIVTSQILRLIFYLRIPELEPPLKQKINIKKNILSVLRSEGFFSYCSYVFLLTLFTMGCPALFGLIEKKVLMLGDHHISLLGSAMFAGVLAGSLAGGYAIDKYGTKRVFLICHFSYSSIILLFILRETLPMHLLLSLGGLNFCFGAISGALNIAIASELMALFPPKLKSLAGSIFFTLFAGGKTLSIVLSAWVVKLGILQKSWTLLGCSLSQYDSILLSFAVMVVLLVVTLGLVPSVLNKSQWLPGNI